MEPEGEAKLKQLAGEIREMVTALPDCKPYTFPFALVLTSWSHDFAISVRHLSDDASASESSSQLCQLAMYGAKR